MGGIGKTTLARMWGKLYGQKHPEASIWEINAETQTSLTNSFRELALALAQRPQQKEELRYIDGIKNTDQQEKQRLQFVRGCLKEQDGGWLFIFDNVESYQAIKDYLPQDSMIWGKGQVIITTRNAHLQEAEGVRSDSMINLEELNAEEGLTLFARIRFKCEPKHLSVKEQTRAMDFLKEIPPFPLDISTAARYMSHYKLSYDEYKEQLKAQSQEFNKNQENLLKETSRYTQTRYCIITLALKRMIENNKKFADLLLLISLLDSQNIPLSLFIKRYSNEITTLIALLKKEALISISDLSIFTDKPFRLISWHRSTQQICLHYFINTLSKNEISKLTTSLTGLINDFLCTEKMPHLVRSILPHGEKLFHNPYLVESEKASLGITIGIAFQYSGDDCKAKQYLEESTRTLSATTEKEAKKYLEGYKLLVELYRRHGYFTSAMSLLEKCNRLCAKFGWDREKLFIDIIEGRLNIDIGEFKMADSLLSKSIHYLQKQNDESAYLARALVHRGLLNQEIIGKIPNVAKDILLAKEIYKKLSDVLGEAWAESQLGVVYGLRGDLKMAEKILSKSMVSNKIYKADTHVFFGNTLTELAIICKEVGDYGAAERYLRESIKVFQINNTTVYLIWGKKHLGELYMKTGRYLLARHILEKSLNEHLKVYGTIGCRTGWMQITMGEFLNYIGEYAGAQKILRSSLTINQKVFSSNRKVGKIHLVLGKVYINLKQYSHAMEALKKSLCIYENLYGKKHLRVAEPLRYLGELYLKLGDVRKAEELMQQSLHILKTNSEAPNHPDQHWSLESLATLYEHKAEEAMKNGRPQESIRSKQQAKNYLKEALTIAEAHFPKDSAHTQRIQQRLSQIG